MSLSRKNSRFSIFQLIRVLIFQFALYQISRATSIIDTASLSSTQGIILPISTSSQSLTSSSTGDFNGDGFEDILIGLPYYSSSTLSACGIVYVIFGTANGIPNINPSTMSLSDGIQITGRAANSNLGLSVAGLGDINGDTIDDFAIGSQGASYAYVIFGKTNGHLSNIDLASTDISATNQGIVMMGVARLGTQVDSAGDFNDDGVNDFMVSSTNVFTSRGAVYVIFGKAGISSYFDLSTITLTPPDGFVIVGEAFSQLGRSLSKLGDVNGDGIEDIMAGTNGVTGGMVMIVYGTKTPISTVQADTLLSSQGIIITGSSSSTIGARDSINSVADLNNDGVDDIALGVPTYSANPIINTGMVYIVYGQKGGFSGNIDLSSSWNGFQVKGVPQSSWKFGNSITSADINGDGLADLIVGTPGAAAPAGSIAGICYVLFGNVNGFSNIDLANSWSQSPQVLKVYGDATGFQLGSLVKPAKDLNKDGVNDFISIGTRNAYVFYGDGCGSLVQCDSASLSPICYASKGCVCGEYGLYFLRNACVSQCAEGYYANTAICESCPVSCATCTSPSVCQACNEGYIFSGTTCEAIPQVLSGAATALNHAQVAASIATIVMTILAFANPGPIVIVSLSGVFLALKLMKINYPPRLEYLLENSGSGDTIFDQITSPPEALVDHMTNYSLPEKFKDVGFYSNFLVNFWPSLITIVGVITLALVAIFLNYSIIPSRIGTYTKTKKIAFWLHSKFKQAVKWNLLISTFIGCLGDIGMFTTLELRALHFDSVLEGLSFNICLALNIAGIFIQVLLIYVVWKLRKAYAQSRQKNNPNIFQNTKKDLESYRVIFEVFKEDTFLHQSFLFIFNFKMYFFFAVISYFPDSPVVSTLINSIVGLFVLLYLTLVRPHKEKIEFVSLLIAEVLYEITNICAFLLALDDTYDLNFGNSRIRLGDVIILCNCTFMTLALAFLAIQIFNLIKDIYSFIRELIKQRKNRDNNKDVTSIEQYPLNLSGTAKSAESSIQIHKNSNGLDSHINLFERRIKKPRNLSLLAKIQDLDDHEIAQVQFNNNIDHTDNDPQAQEITGINLPINSNNGLQDPVGRNILIDKNQMFLPPSRLLPAKTIQNPWTREQND